MTLYRDDLQHLYDIERRRIVMPEKVTMRLNRGERPEKLPGWIRSELTQRLSHYTDCLQQYPSYQPFYEKLADHIGVPVNQIVVGAGIEEFIRTLTFLCCKPGEKAVVLWPTCAMYEIYAAAFGVELVRVKPVPGMAFSMETFIKQIPEDTRVVFVPNPGQPVETCFTPTHISVLAEFCNSYNMVLAIDEAHYGFGAPTMLPLILKHDNLLVMRTFSKFYAAAGARVGFAVGQERVIKPLEASRPSGEISGPSMVIASALMDHHDELCASAEETAKTRDSLVDTIWKRLGLRAWGRWGFSVLIEFPSAQRAVGVAARLAEQGILVKAGFSEPVERCMLVACGSLPLMTDFYVALEHVVAYYDQEDVAHARD